MQDITTAKDVEISVFCVGDEYKVRVSVDGVCILRIREITGELICDDPVRGRDCVNWGTTQ